MKMRGSRGGESGQAVVFLALVGALLMACMALGIDVGRAYIVRVQAQNAADAAALAGAESLPDAAQAQAAAQAAAAANGFSLNPDPPDVALQPSSPGISWDNEIEVTLRTTIANTFAGVLGFPTTTVVVHSAALANEAIPVDGRLPDGAYYGGLMPWGLCSSALPGPTPTALTGYTTSYPTAPSSDPAVTLKQGAPGTAPGADLCGGSGNFGPVDLDYTSTGNCVTGAQQYGQDIAFGSATAHFVGDQICTEPGNVVGKTDSGLAQMLANCRQATGTPCSAIGVIVPIVSGTENGRSDVTIAGFALAILSSSTIESLTSNDDTFTAQLAAVYAPPTPAAAGDCNPAALALPCPPPLSWDTAQGLLTQ